MLFVAGKPRLGSESCLSPNSKMHHRLRTGKPCSYPLPFGVPAVLGLVVFLVAWSLDFLVILHVVTIAMLVMISARCETPEKESIQDVFQEI